MSLNDVWKKSQRGILNNIGSQPKNWINPEGVKQVLPVKITDRPRRIGTRQAGLKDYRET